MTIGDCFRFAVDGFFVIYHFKFEKEWSSRFRLDGVVVESINLEKDERFIIMYNK